MTSKQIIERLREETSNKFCVLRWRGRDGWYWVDAFTKSYDESRGRVIEYSVANRYQTEEEAKSVESELISYEQIHHS